MADSHLNIMSIRYQQQYQMEVIFALDKVGVSEVSS